MNKLLAWWYKFVCGDSKTQQPKTAHDLYGTRVSLRQNWSGNISERKLWGKNNWKWIHEPFWYCNGTDDPDKGARCAQCDEWVERKDCGSLQVHELNHWD